MTTFHGDIAALFAALAKAQGSMGGAKKGAKNPFFKSRYADLASVLEAIVPALNAHGLALLQLPGFDGETGRPTLTTIICHEGGGRIESVSSIPAAKMDPQGYGSAISYLRRYAAQAALAVPAVDDDGEGAMMRHAPLQERLGRAKPPRQAAPPPPQQAAPDALHHPSWAPQRKAFCARLADAGWKYDEVAWICEELGRPRPSAVDAGSRRRMLGWFEAMSDEEANNWAAMYNAQKTGEF